MATDALGLGLDTSLGDQYQEFLRAPAIGRAVPASAMAWICLGVGVALAAFTGQAAWHRRREWRNAWRTATDTSVATSAALLVFGALLTLSGMHLYRHYLIVTYPFEWLLVPLLAIRFAPGPRWWLLALCLAQLGLSVAFLNYIHVHHGAVHGDYGPAYDQTG
jgi:hypothetical protein